MAAAGRMQGMDALIADDDAVSRELLQCYLESLGARVVVVNSGSEALMAFEERKGRFNLVILDACMPGPAPRILHEQIARCNPAVPILFCSSFGAEEPALQFIGESGLGLLSKPFDRPTCFRAVTAALKKADEAPTSAAASVATEPARRRSSGGTATSAGSRTAPAARPADVLIADDEAVHRKVLEFYLGSFGCRVQAACDGDEMLAACRQIADSLKLVILDVRMPGPSPLQMYQQIHEIRPELPVLFCSAADPDDPAICSINKHGLKLLPKPYHRSDLRQAIQNLMS